MWHMVGQYLHILTSQKMKAVENRKETVVGAASCVVSYSVIIFDPYSVIIFDRYQAQGLALPEPIVVDDELPLPTQQGSQVFSEC